MKKDIDIQKISDAVGCAVRYMYALHGLLDTLEQHHFDMTLSAARDEAGVDDVQEGSFWWMQNHYTAVGNIVLAANCIAETLEKSLSDLDDYMPPLNGMTEKSA